MKITILTASGPCLLRQATPKDAAFLQALFAYDKTADLAQTGLKTAQIDALIAMQHRARDVSYAAAFPNARAWILEHIEQPVGRLLETTLASERYVIDIAVAPAHRRSGLAEALISWLMLEAGSRGLNVSARIYRQNKASRSLFQKLNFDENSWPDDAQVQLVWRSPCTNT